MKTIHNYYQVWRQYGSLPEFYNIPKTEAQASRDGYPLRPGYTDTSIKLSTLNSRAFTVAGPTIWNNLPVSMTSAPSLSMFRQRLKTFS